MLKNETLTGAQGNRTHQHLNTAMKSSLLMAGKIFPFLEHFAFTKEDLRAIHASLVDAIHPGDLMFLFAVAFLATPLFALFYNTFFSHASGRSYSKRHCSFKLLTILARQLASLL